MNETLQTTLLDTVSFLNDQAIRYALIGGLAASIRGEPRVTADVDLVIAADLDRALRLVAVLKDGKFEPLFAQVEEVVQQALILPLRHRTTRVKVDLAIGLSGFERQLIERAADVEIDGLRIPVATAEDLLIMKALAARPRDDQDAIGLIIAQGENLDWEYCLKTAKQLGDTIGHDLSARIEALRGSIGPN
jgi:predicted nucleotidyltransferase